MIITPIQIAGGFMFLCTLLLIGVLYSRIHWMLKAILVISSLGFCVLSYKAYEDALGYPVPMEAPSKFEFLFGVVREPMFGMHIPGALFIWILETNSLTPRAIELPYSKEDRDIIGQAREKVKHGERVFMSNAGGKNVNGDNGSANGNGSADGHSNSSVQYMTKNHVLDFIKPSDTLPKKAQDNSD